MMYNILFYDIELSDIEFYRMYVYLYVCACVYSCVYLYNVCVYVCMCICMLACMYFSVYSYECVCTCYCHRDSNSIYTPLRVFPPDKQIALSVSQSFPKKS